eukprot:gene9083-18820_t
MLQAVLHYCNQGPNQNVRWNWKALKQASYANFIQDFRTSAHSSGLYSYTTSKQSDYTHQPRPVSPYHRVHTVDKSGRSQNSAGYAVNNRPVYNILTGENTHTPASTKSRPSSAGPTNRVRPTTYVAPVEDVNINKKNGLSWLTANLALDKVIPETYELPRSSSAQQQSSGYARPKSAGTNRPSQGSSNDFSAIRKTTSQNYATDADNSNNHNKPHNNSSEKDRRRDTDPTPTRRTSESQAAIAAAGAAGVVSSSSSSSKPRTSGILQNNNNNNNNTSFAPSAQEHWTTSYRMHYGAATGIGTGTGTTGNVSQVPSGASGSGYAVGSGLTADRLVPSSSKSNPYPTQTQTTAGGTHTHTDTTDVQTGQGRTTYASSRIRAAMDHSCANTNTATGTGTEKKPVGVAVAGNITNTMGDTNNDNKYAVKPTLDAEDEDDDGDVVVEGEGLEDPMEGALEGDDDEMDGKRVNDSRSHPEASTPSQSLELNGYDIRGNSYASSTERNLGLSSLPNEYCSMNEAQDLKKLLVPTRLTPGIVPSTVGAMDMYMVGKVVGVGSYGKVRAAWHRLTANKVAIKTYDKVKVKDPAHWKRVQSEIKIMEQVSHPRIARMYEAVETSKRMHIIMESIEGGNLCSYVKAKRRLSEEESRRIFFQLLQAMDYLHNLNFVHRDIKLENVLFGEGKDIKLIDFGFSTVHQHGKRLRVFCGTPSYMAPEIVRRTEYDGKPTDMWSMGILLYALLCGCFPFRARSYPDLYRRIARGHFTVPEELSTSVKDLLRQLLQLDAHTRVTASNALRHPWLAAQLVHAPDMSRLRSESPILVSDRASDDVDEQVILEIQYFGITREEVLKQILSKVHSSLTTLYYLLRQHVVNNRRTTMANAQRKPSLNSSPTKRPIVATGPALYSATTRQHENIPPQILQGVLNNVRPRSASSGRLGASYNNRPRSAAATRRS